ncbi:MAG: FAD-dependent oxidoreductase [Candidatus Aminicenantales bacterium]
MTNSRLSVGVVGGGLLGMALSLRLAESGLDVTLMETSENTGGVAASCAMGDYRWDRFYHVILLSDSHLLSLLDELGLKDRLSWGVTKTGYCADGKLYSISNLVEYLLFPPLNILDKFRLGWTIFYGSKIKNWRRLERITAVDWLKRHSGRATFDKMWLPLLKSKLGADYGLASASFIWAHISRLYAARRTGLKKEMFGYVDGGYQTIIDALQRSLDDRGVTTLAGTRVHKVKDEGPRVTIETGRGESRHFDKVVLTVPCTRILELCPQLSVQETARLKSVVHQDLLCAALILKKPLSDFYITNIAEGSIPFTGIIEMTALVDRANFGGHSLVYLPRYLTKGDPLFQKDDEAVKDIFLSSLRIMYPDLGSDDLVASCISRIVDFPVIPTLDYYEKSFPPSATSMRNVFIANSAQIPNGTNNVNEIVALANGKALEFVGEFKHSPEFDKAAR